VTLPNPGVAVTGVKISSLPTNAIRYIILYHVCYVILYILLYIIYCVLNIIYCAIGH
jgi:hypothetical protein